MVIIQEDAKFHRWFIQRFTEKRNKLFCTKKSIFQSTFAIEIRVAIENAIRSKFEKKVSNTVYEYPPRSYSPDLQYVVLRFRLTQTNHVIVRNYGLAG